MKTVSTLQWRHNERDGVSNHQRSHCLLNHSFGCRSKNTSKLRVTGLCAGNSTVTRELPAHKAGNAEKVSIMHVWPGYRKLPAPAIKRLKTDLPKTNHGWANSDFFVNWERGILAGTNAVFCINDLHFVTFPSLLTHVNVCTELRHCSGKLHPSLQSKATWNHIPENRVVVMSSVSSRHRRFSLYFGLNVDSLTQLTPVAYLLSVSANCLSCVDNPANCPC